MRRKLTVNQPCNWLLTLTLHAVSSFADHAELSDVEAGIIKAFTENGYSDKDLIQQGELAMQLPSARRAELFPPRFASRMATATTRSRSPRPTSPDRVRRTAAPARSQEQDP